MTRTPLSRPDTHLALLRPPYDSYSTIAPGWATSELPPRGKAIVWWLVDAPHQEEEFTWLQERTPGLPLLIILPPARSLARALPLLSYVALVEPRAVLPFTRTLSLEAIRRLLQTPPRSVPQTLTAYLSRRGLLTGEQERQDIRRIFELAPTVKSISAVARKLSTSRRTLGRRFANAGLPVPSHWLQFGRLFHAAVRLQQEPTAMFRIAAKLGYSDGFTMSNQMKRLIDCRPTDLRTHLGWEWIVESWIKREVETSGIDVHRYRAAVGCYLDSRPQAV
jgi:AraC-like DNA-binding protein